MTEKYEVTTDPNGNSLSMDTRYFPVLICRWTGTPTIESMKWYFERRKPHLNRAVTVGTKVIAVSDLSEASSPPATVRQYMGEAAKTEDTHAGLQGYVVIVPNAVVRGVVTALRWIVGGDSTPTVFASNMDEGLKKVAQMAESANIELPTFKYSPP